MTERRVVLVFSIAILLMGIVAHADVVDDAEKEFRNQRYGLVFQSLLAYRFDNEGTLRSDFMLAVSACNLSDPDFKAFGGALLTLLPSWYNVQALENIQTINNQRRDCPSRGLSEEAAVARLKGKADTGNHDRLEPRRSSSGNASPLPFAPVRTGGSDVVPPPPTRRMGPLMTDRGFMSGTDYKQARTGSAAECSDLCEREDQCVAITYLVKEKTCYLKNALTQLVSSGNMVSASKR